MLLSLLLLLLLVFLLPAVIVVVAVVLVVAAAVRTVPIKFSCWFDGRLSPITVNNGRNGHLRNLVEERNFIQTVPSGGGGDM